MSQPIVTITNIDHITISNKTGKNQSHITFQFDVPVVEYVLRTNGTDQTTGILAEQKSFYVADLASLTVSQSSLKTVDEIRQINANTEIIAEVDNSELYQEGNNRINIYGLSTTGEWTPYNQV